MADTEQVSTATLINGVPADQYGLWCSHGKRLMVPNPANPGDYPGTVFADPWPCADGCTPERLAAEMQAEADAYEDERWNDYYDGIREIRNHADDLPGASL